MTIYERLKQDHEEIRSLLSQLVVLVPGQESLRGDLIHRIRDELIPHSRAEEAVFYNALRSVSEGKRVVMESYEEHIEAEALLRFLQIQDKIDFKWKATAEKLQKALEHHIYDEETKLFDVARKIFTGEESIMMVDAFERLKNDFSDDGFMKSSFELVVNMMPPRFTSSFRDFNIDLH